VIIFKSNLFIYLKSGTKLARSLRVQTSADDVVSGMLSGGIRDEIIAYIWCEPHLSPEERQEYIDALIQANDGINPFTGERIHYYATDEIDLRAAERTVTRLQAVAERINRIEQSERRGVMAEEAAEPDPAEEDGSDYDSDSDSGYDTADSDSGSDSGYNTVDSDSGSEGYDTA
jgi:hypothetical protein